MDIDNLTIKQARELAAMFSGNSQKPTTRVEGDGRAVIVRCRDAGVHYGKLAAYEGRTVWLNNSRRLWSWTANEGIALSGVAAHGIKAAKSKVDSLASKIVLLDACEIIDCTDVAAKSIEAA